MPHSVPLSWSAEDELLSTVGIRVFEPTFEDRLAFGFLILEGERF